MVETRFLLASAAIATFLLIGESVLPLRIGIQLANLKKPFKQALIQAAQLARKASRSTPVSKSALRS